MNEMLHNLVRDFNKIKAKQYLIVNQMDQLIFSNCIEICEKILEKCLYEEYKKGEK